VGHVAFDVQDTEAQANKQDVVACVFVFLSRRPTAIQIEIKIDGEELLRLIDEHEGLPLDHVGVFCGHAALELQVKATGKHVSVIDMAISPLHEFKLDGTGGKTLALSKIANTKPGGTLWLGTPCDSWVRAFACHSTDCHIFVKVSQQVALQTKHPNGPLCVTAWCVTRM
jgi:hypothetical protein